MLKRKQYTKEFKLDAISLVMDQGLTIAEAARSLEINANMLNRQWNGLLPLNGIVMCQTKDFSNQIAGGEYDYSTCGS